MLHCSQILKCIYVVFFLLILGWKKNKKKNKKFVDVTSDLWKLWRTLFFLFLGGMISSVTNKKVNLIIALQERRYESFHKGTILWTFWDSYLYFGYLMYNVYMLYCLKNVLHCPLKFSHLVTPSIWKGAIYTKVKTLKGV